MRLQPVPYLADVARLEFARGRAYHAADASRCNAPPSPHCQRGISAFARVMLHPSVGIVASHFPVLSIWEVNKDRAVRAVPHWAAEAAVVARPFLEVETRRLLPGTDVFLLALQARSTIAEAVERAAAATSEFNASDGLALLIGTHLAVALDEVG